jgi:hypothetical protein
MAAVGAARRSPVRRSASSSDCIGLPVRSASLGDGSAPCPRLALP